MATLLGASYLQAGDSARALAALSPFAEAAGNDPNFLWSFGSALIANGRLHDGVVVVERVAKQTNAAEAWMTAGQNLLRLNEFVQAREDLETAARVDPNLPGVQTGLGQSREKNADYEGAIQAYKKAVEQIPRTSTPGLGWAAINTFCESWIRRGSV